MKQLLLAMGLVVIGMATAGAETWSQRTGCEGPLILPGKNSLADIIKVQISGKEMTSVSYREFDRLVNSDIIAQSGCSGSCRTSSDCRGPCVCTPVGYCRPQD